MEESIARDELKRVPYWTESIAVGSAGSVGKVEPMVLVRGEMQTEQVQEGVMGIGGSGRSLRLKNRAKRRL